MSPHACLDGTVVKDAMAGKPLPSGKWANVTSSTLVISGELSEPFFHEAAKTLSNHLARAKDQVLGGLGSRCVP